jgi:hypothetical protein
MTLRRPLVSPGRAGMSGRSVDRLSEMVWGVSSALGMVFDSYFPATP